MSQGFQRGAQTIHRALQILDAFALDEPSQTLQQLSTRVRLTVPTTHRILKALESREFVMWDPEARKYSLGLGIVRLANVVMRRDNVAAVAQPSLGRLRILTGETVGLHWLTGEKRVCVAEEVSRQPIKMATGIGTIYPLYAGAAGKAMLAWLEPRQIDRILSMPLEMGWPSRRPAQEIVAELEEIRRRGYALSFGETVPGASAIAAPIFNAGGKPVAAINITGPAERLTIARVEEIAEGLLRETHLIMSSTGASWREGQESAPEAT